MAAEDEMISTIFRLNLFHYSGGSCEDGCFNLDSATSAPFYIDINSIASFPHYRALYIDALAEMVRKLAPNSHSHKEKGNISPLIIAASGHTGIPFASFVSGILDLPMVYIRESSKKHGKKNMIEGSAQEGSSVIIFTECLSSPYKVENAIKALTDKGCHVGGIATFVNLLGREYLETEGVKIPVESSMSLKAIIDYAGENFLLDKKIIHRVSEWSSAAFYEEKAAKLPGASCEGGRAGAEGFQEAEIKAAEILLDIKAVTLSVSEPFRYASGILSPIYCDNRLMISSPGKWESVIGMMENIIRSKTGLENIEVIAGTSTAGIPHAARLAARLNLPLVYVKSEPGETGKKSCVEGTLQYGKSVLVVEDLVSTGKSSIEAVRILREHGAVVKCCIAIFSYQMKSAVKAFAEENCALFTASNFSVLIKAAVEKKYITQEEADKAVSWNLDPENWGKTHGYE